MTKNTQYNEIADKMADLVGKQQKCVMAWLASMTETSLIRPGTGQPYRPLAELQFPLMLTDRIMSLLLSFFP